jgi:rsbT co-antagonist protein RsbR
MLGKARLFRSHPGRLILAITMTKDELAFHADVIARVFRMRGDKPAADAIAMLQALGLTDDQAAEVIAYGLAHDLFTENKSFKDDSVHLERRRSAVELERRADLFHLLQQTLPIVVWEIDTQGILLQMQGNGLNSIGLPQGHFVGTSAFELFAEQNFVESLRQAAAGQPAHVFAEYGGLPWELWCIPLRDEQGHPVSVVGIALDISEAKRAESELRSKLDLIERQQRVISELSTPIIEVWDKVLTLPLLGVVDSGRAAEVMENLLTRVAQTGARFTVLDLTGVETVDTGTASHLLKLIQAVRLLGAEGLITGIQPNVAQTMVTLGLDLGQIVTLANLREGLQYCMKSMRESPG